MKNLTSLISAVAGAGLLALAGCASDKPKELAKIETAETPTNSSVCKIYATNTEEYSICVASCTKESLNFHLKEYFKKELVRLSEKERTPEEQASYTRTLLTLYDLSSEQEQKELESKYVIPTGERIKGR